MGKYAFGVDIGGTTVKIGLFEAEGNLLEKWEIPTRKNNRGAEVLPDVAGSVLAKMKERAILPKEVIGVGVGAPGAVAGDGFMVNGAVNIGWGPFHLTRTLQEYLQIPVISANDANAAAFGEMWQGGGRGYRNMVAVTLGTGVGGGIIIDGKLVAGATGAGGEIGHIHISDEETQECGCKNKGCLEQYASATGLVRLAEKRLAADLAPSVLRGQEISARTVFDAVKAGDSVAMEIAEEFGDYLGKGLAIVAAVVNPEIFVIGGGVSGAGEILLRYVEPAFSRYVFAACRNVKFTLATLGNDAGIYGAAGLVLQSE